MKKLSLYISFLIVFLSNISAQDNIQIQSVYRGSAASARFFPSTQMDQYNKMEFSFNYNFFVANKSLTYGSIRQIQKENRLTAQDVQNIIEDLDENNRIGVGQDLLIFGLGLKTKIKNHPVVWNFTISDRFNVNLLIPKTLLQLMWQGNKQFSGQTLDLSQTSISGLYFREYSLGLATQIKEWDDWKFRGGLRLNYYQGLSAIQNSKKEFYFTTAAEAEYIRMDYDFEYNYTGIDDFNLLDPRGYGWGISLGTTFSYKDKLFFDIGVTDMGNIKFNEDIFKVGTKNNYQFDGLDLGEILNPTAFLDSLETIFTPQVDSLGKGEFKMNVGTRLSFMTSWVFGKTTENRGSKTLTLFYSQGFSEKPGSTTSPNLALNYHQTVFKHVVYGFSTSFGGFNDVAVGGLLGLRFKHYRLSIQSDDFTGFIFPDKTTGAGFGLLFQILI